LTAPVAGWYPDRNEANLARWWDGREWTEHTQSTAPAAAAFEQPVSAAAFGLGPGAGETPREPMVHAEAAPVAPVAPIAPVAPVAPIEGWYEDPWDASMLRWWDGSQWTAHLHEAQAAGVSS
jgi:hypothetical protein